MESALELSQAVELRGVNFKEHKIGGLLVRPVPAPKPARTVVPEYKLAHITDLADIADEDVDEFVRGLPGLISMMKIAKHDGSEQGLELATVMPIIRFIPDSSDQVQAKSGDIQVTATIAEMQAGWERTKPTADGKQQCSGECHVVRDQDAPRHGCCQTCGEVKHLG